MRFENDKKIIKALALSQLILDINNELDPQNADYNKWQLRIYVCFYEAVIGLIFITALTR